MTSQAAKNGSANIVLEEQFLIDWTAFRKETALAHKQIAEMHTNTAHMMTYAKNLSVLPEISRTLIELKQDLVKPATSKNQVPISIFMIVVLVLAVVIIFQVVKDGQSVKLSTDGLIISNEKPK